jgi:hypothetical protein
VPFANSFFTRSPAIPRPAVSLRRLARQIDARWPDRSTASDGWIGDRRHVTEHSDHNPDERGVVRALDVTADGIDPEKLVRVAKRHPAVEYVIWDRRIWSRSHGFKPRAYVGDNPHTDHVHISLRDGDRARLSRVPWF